MTQLVGNFTLVNVFACNPRTMLSAVCSHSQRQEMFFLVPGACFMLYLAESGSFSGH
jgi:hypothetical protein